MQIFQNISIRRKQTLIIMLTSSVVLLLACAAFVAYDTVTFRQELSGQVTILADAVGNNCAAAIDFNDPRAAEETLAALRANANIVSACVYSRDGQVFAIYQRDGASKFMPPAVRPAGQEFTRDELHLFRVIKQGGEMAGTIFVASDLKNLSARLMSYVEIVGMVFLTALLAALLLSSRLQRLVSNPIMHLAQVARTVAQDKNYSVRATKHGNDEIGQLVEGFNEMLAQIQRRDAALQSTRDDLEVRVAERTADLEKTNAALDAAQGLYHSLVEQLPANVYRKDAEGRFIFVNSRFCKSKGKTADEILGQVASVVNSKEAVDRVAKEHELIMRTGRSIEKEEFYTQRDGTVQYLQVLKSPVLDADGKIIGTQGIQFDITQRRQAEDALRESQALYHSLVDQMPAAVFRKDAEGRYVFVNSSFCRIMEMLPDQILGKTAFELVSGMKATQSNRHPVSDKLGAQGMSHHELIMQTGQPIMVEDEYQGSDGKRSFYHTVKSAVYGADGKVAGSQGMLFDITDRKQAEKELAYERDLLRTLLDSSPDQIYFKDAQSRFIKCSKSQAKNSGVSDVDAMVGKTDFDFFTEEHARPAFEDEQEIIRTGRPLTGKVEKENWKDGRVTWVMTNKMPMRNQDGEIIGTMGISKDITAIKQAETELAYQRDLLETLMNHSPDTIFFKDLQSRLVKVSRSEAVNLFRIALSRHRDAHPGDSADQLPAHLASLERFHEYIIGKTDADTYGSEHASSFNLDEQEIIRTGQPILGKIERTVCPDGSNIWFMTTKLPWHNQDGKIIGTFGTSRDISDLKNAEAKVEEAHKALLETSRQAGMAEIATNVLHNIGNVLNSVNVSASLVVDSVKKSKAANLAKVAAMLREHERDLGTFITSDAKGRQLPVYLGQLSEQLLADQTGAIQELDLLVKNIEHIKDVVTMQQSYARVSGVKEIINVCDLVEDGLRMNAGALSRHNVEVIREFEDVPPINVDKHRVLQILVNLIRNAKYACDELGREDKQMTVRVANGEGRIKISVADNGVGIPPENLTRIFNHGFTTRKNGHGFGLHSGALAAKEMGGSLAVQSDGIGRGATFILELPALSKSPPT